MKHKSGTFVFLCHSEIYNEMTKSDDILQMFTALNDSLKTIRYKCIRIIYSFVTNKIWMLIYRYSVFCHQKYKPCINIYKYIVLYIGNKETINWILVVRMKSEREINKKEMFFSTLRPFKLMLSSECD